jgi:arylsulfatase A-like enzyme
MLMLVLLQRLAAARAELDWAPLPLTEMLARDGLTGLALGGLIGLCAWLSGPWVGGRRALTAAGAALLPTALRVLVSVGRRGYQDLPGGRFSAVPVAALAVLAAVWILSRALGRRGSALRPVREGLLVGLPCLVAVQLAQLVALTGTPEDKAVGMLGAKALLAVLACLAAGLITGRLLLPGTGRASRALGATLLMGALAWGWLALEPRTADAPPVAAPADAPNVLLVVLDTLRRDQVSAHGVVTGTTPRLDGLAARGVRFEDALSSSNWTVPSHASLFTGSVVLRHGVGGAQRQLRVHPGGDDTPPLPTLAEIMGTNGYETAAIVCNMNVTQAWGFDRGFRRFFEVWRARQGDHDLLGILATRFGLTSQDEGAAAATRGVVAWLESHREAERPWLLFVNLLEAHWPFGTAPEPHRSAYLRPGEPSESVEVLAQDEFTHVWNPGVSRADAEQLWRLALGDIRYQDEQFGHILDALAASGLAQDTLVIVTSDHGEHFGRDGLLGHGQNLDDELLAIPMIMAGPGVPVGVVDDAPASLVDVLPTVLSLAGLPPPPPDPGRTGIPLLGPDRPDDDTLGARARHAGRPAAFLDHPDEFPTLVAEPQAERRWAWSRHGLALGEDLWVEVGAPESEQLPPRLLRRLPDAPPAGSSPPAPTRASVSDPERAALLAELLELYRSRVPHALLRPDDVDTAWDTELLEQLRKLGYVGGDGRRTQTEESR